MKIAEKAKAICDFQFVEGKGGCNRDVCSTKLVSKILKETFYKAL